MELHGFLCWEVLQIEMKDFQMFSLFCRSLIFGDEDVGGNVHVTSYRRLVLNT